MKNEGTRSGRAEKLELFVNIALVLAGLVLVASLANKFFWQKDAVAADEGLVIENGAKLDWPNMDWSRNGRTIVLALSTSCHFCTESAPFYQKLTRELSRQGGNRIVAVLPQPVSEGQKYLQDLGFNVDEVRQANMASIGLPATPALALVNDAGVVTGIWVGKLGVNQQYDVFKRLNISSSHGLADTENGVTSIDAQTLKGAIERKERFTLVDVESRDLYKLEHIPGALNIPMDELEARSDDELLPDDTLIIYSHGIDDETSENAVSILVNEGFKKVSLLRGGYTGWQQVAGGVDSQP